MKRWVQACESARFVLVASGHVGAGHAFFFFFCVFPFPFLSVALGVFRVCDFHVCR